jgi:hypothetical protein
MGFAPIDSTATISNPRVKQDKEMKDALEKSSEPDMADKLLRSAETSGFMRARSSRGRRASFLTGAYDTSSILGGR